MPQLSIGGQAVLEGVMMRSKDQLAIAVRRPDGTIFVERRPWFVLSRWAWLKWPCIRGFPILFETLINGIQALNFSARQAVPDEEELSATALGLTLAVSIGLALLLFVGLPHFFSLGMAKMGLGGGIEAISFHLWDGLFRLVLFLGYIGGIALLPDVRRFFQYHGAEHKVIHAFELDVPLEISNIRIHSRLHPRCGTAFLLFVLALSILLFTLIVPALLSLYNPPNAIFRHGSILLVKLLLMVPISGLGYELIKVAGKFQNSIWCSVLCWPGMLLQLVTTREPDDGQIEVALAALHGAVGTGEDSVCQT